MLRLKRLLFTIFLACFFNPGYAQNKRLDSTLAVYHSTVEDDTTKFKLLRNIVYDFRSIDLRIAVSYGDTLMILAKHLNQPVWVAKAYETQADLLANSGKQTEGIYLYNKGLSYLMNDKTPAALREKASLYTRLGDACRNSSDYGQALEYFNKELDVGYSLGEASQIIKAKNGIAITYMAIADWETALVYLEEIKDEVERQDRKMSDNYAAALLNIGNIKMVQKKYAESLEDLSAAIDYGYKLKNKQVEMFGKLTISGLYYKMGNVEASYNTAIESYDYYFKRKSATILSSCYKNLGRVFMIASDSFLLSKNILPQQRFDTAAALLQKSLQIAKDIHSLTEQEDPLEDLSLLYEKQGDDVKAYGYYKDFKVIHDSLGNLNQQKSIVVNDLQHQFSRQTDSLKFKNALQRRDLENDLSVNKQQAFIANTQKKLDGLLFLQTRSTLENTNLQNSENEKELLLAKKEKEIRNAELNRLAKDKEYTSLKLKQQRTYLVIVLAILFIIVYFLFYRSRLRRRKLAAASAAEEAAAQLHHAELASKMNDMMLSALRSQMNPHFIFNCLNAIKLYTMENDTDTASDYISKFAKLIRSMLESSRSDRVTLASEMEAIRLYIELEAMRFKNKLNYHIHIDTGIDAAFAELPPLLVQPYVENAIWHGLMPKAEGGTITINVNLTRDKNAVSIEIRDDGVGRESSLAAKKTMDYNNIPGTKVTGERIALINQKFKSDASVITNDLYKNGVAAGTQVMIELPLE